MNKKKQKQRGAQTRDIGVRTDSESYVEVLLFLDYFFNIDVHGKPSISFWTLSFNELNDMLLCNVSNMKLCPPFLSTIIVQKCSNVSKNTRALHRSLFINYSPVVFGSFHRGLHCSIIDLTHLNQLISSVALQKQACVLLLTLKKSLTLTMSFDSHSMNFLILA